MENRNGFHECHLMSQAWKSVRILIDPIILGWISSKKASKNTDKPARPAAASTGAADPHQQLLALASLENRDLHLVFISLQIFIDPHLTLHTYLLKGEES